jgi:hypothetical protein
MIPRYKLAVALILVVLGAAAGVVCCVSLSRGLFSQTLFFAGAGTLCVCTAELLCVTDGDRKQTRERLARNREEIGLLRKSFSRMVLRIDI